MATAIVATVVAQLIPATKLSKCKCHTVAGRITDVHADHRFDPAAVAHYRCCCCCNASCNTPCSPRIPPQLLLLGLPSAAKMLACQSMMHIL